MEERPVALPELKRFDDIFYSVSAWADVKPEYRDTPLLTLKSGKENMKVGRYISCTPVDKRASMCADSVNPVVLDKISERALVVNDDMMYWSVVFRSNGTALILCKYNRIIGSIWVAVVDSSTVPSVF